jgi:hypothetical protein
LSAFIHEPSVHQSLVPIVTRSQETWEIRYLVVDAQNWWPGKKVLVAPQWIGRVSWSDSKVYVDLSRETIKHGPEYHPEALSRKYEETLYDYKRPKYWDR